MAIVKSSLSGLEGVTASKISLTEAFVWYNPQLTNPEQIVAEITKSGYAAKVFEVKSVESNSIPKNCLILDLFC